MTQNAEISAGEAKLNFDKRPINDILNDSEHIDCRLVAKEVLNWAIANVETFIDNSQRNFKVDLNLINAKGMEETEKLQNLYRAIPDDDENNEKEIEKAEKCRRILDKIVAKAYKEIQELKEEQKKLFKRMVFYYERVIPNPEGRERAMQIDRELKTLVLSKEAAEDKDAVQKQIMDLVEEGRKLVKFEELKGNVDITKFDYEAFSIGVQIKAPDLRGEKTIVKDYVIPEGFTLWMELNYKQNELPISMF